MSIYRQEEKQKLEQLQKDIELLGFKGNITRDNEGYVIGIELDNNVIIRPKSYDKKYHFYMDKKYPFVNYQDTNRISEQFKKPVEVGVLSTKKINDWINYLMNIDKEEKKLSNEKQEKIDTFLKTLEHEPVKWINKSFDTDSKYNGYDIQGGIIKNGINYSFRIDKDSGYIRETIEIDWRTKQNLQSFKAMVKGEYKTQE